MFCPSFLLILRGKPSWKSIGPKFRLQKPQKWPYLKIPFCRNVNRQKAYFSYIFPRICMKLSESTQILIMVGFRPQKKFEPKIQQYTNYICMLISFKCILKIQGISRQKLYMTGGVPDDDYSQDSLSLQTAEMYKTEI